MKLIKLPGICAAIRRLRPAVPGWMGIAGALAVSLCMGVATVLSTDGSLSQAATWEFADLWVVFISLGLFLGLYRLRLPPLAAKIAAIGAGGCYGGYLLSHLLDGWAYRLLRQFHTPEGYPVVFVGVSLPIFLLSVTGGWLLERVTGRGKGVAAC